MPCKKMNCKLQLTDQTTYKNKQEDIHI
jgi:hypothetical protein